MSRLSYGQSFMLFMLQAGDLLLPAVVSQDVVIRIRFSAGIAVICDPRPRKLRRLAERQRAIVVIGTKVAKRATAFASADDRICQTPYKGLPPEAVRWLGSS